MKKLIISIFVMFILISGSCLTIFVFKIPDDVNYTLANADKLKRLQNTEAPRIILLGASNLAFGIDSSMIHNAFNYNVVNMGVHAGLGFRFLLNEIKPNLVENDVVILIPEYQFFYGYFNGKKELLNLINLSPDKRAYLSPIQYVTLLKYLPEVVGDKIQLVIKNKLGLGNTRKIYNRNGFNTFGDLVTHEFTNNKPLNINGTFIIEKSEIDTVISSLKEFHKYCIGKKVTVFMSFPPYPEEVFCKSKITFDNVNSALRDKTDIDVLSTPEKNLFPIYYFFDTFYHLNWKGRKERTNRLINDLRKKIEPKYNENKL